MWFLGVLRNMCKPLRLEWNEGAERELETRWEVLIKREPDHHGYSVWTRRGLCFHWPKMREDLLQYIVAGTKTRLEGGTSYTPAAGQVWLGLYWRWVLWGEDISFFLHPEQLIESLVYTVCRNFLNSLWVTEQWMVWAWYVRRSRFFLNHMQMRLREMKENRTAIEDGRAESWISAICSLHGTFLVLGTIALTLWSIENKTAMKILER